MLYADPGSGAMIWQLLLAFFFGASFFFNRIKTRIACWLSDRRKNEQLVAPAASRLVQPLPVPTEGE